jgi:hypothetical protein
MRHPVGLASVAQAPPEKVRFDDEIGSILFPLGSGEPKRLGDRLPAAHPPVFSPKAVGLLMIGK